MLKLIAKGLRKEKQLNIIISKALDDFTSFSLLDPTDLHLFSIMTFECHGMFSL